MSKQGKYEPAKQTPRSVKKKSKNKLLMSLITSILGMVLSTSMLLGTTMAWFTDTVQVSGNRIRTGDLQVDLMYNGHSLKDNANIKVFSLNDGVWSPNQVMVRDLTVQNNGNLGLKYVMNILIDKDSVDLARYFTVYEKETATTTFAEGQSGLTVQDLLDAGYERVGTLSDIYANGTAVFSGELKIGEVKSRTHSVALHLSSEVFGEAFENRDLDLSIQLSAYQWDAPESEVLFPANSETHTGVLTEPIAFSGGTLILDGVTLDATADDYNGGDAEKQHAIYITGNTKLVLKGENRVTGPSDWSAIYVEKGAKLDISGDTLTAIGNAGTDDAGSGGHGIGGFGAINIHDVKSLTAKGYGKAGFGIGGPSSNITIANTTIETVQGGYVQPNLINDTSYGKSEPEGGAAIGSHTDGAVITLDNVIIKDAKGGSKAAGIGASYWHSVSINITDSDIRNVEGGNASAGIGGSRIRENDSASQNVTININDSKITAKGGEFGAGIGSGYDTHCTLPDEAPVHTINITGNSVINATGGKYGAGIGTGYHVAGLAGKIEETVTVNATAGASREKYTEAMAVGFGVIDKSREAKEGNTSSFDYKGTVITVVSAPDIAGSGS